MKAVHTFVKLCLYITKMIVDELAQNLVNMKEAVEHIFWTQSFDVLIGIATASFYSAQTFVLLFK